MFKAIKNLIMGSVGSGSLIESDSKNLENVHEIHRVYYKVTKLIFNHKLFFIEGLVSGFGRYSSLILDFKYELVLQSNNQSLSYPLNVVIPTKSDNISNNLEAQYVLIYFSLEDLNLNDDQHELSVKIYVDENRFLFDLDYKLNEPLISEDNKFLLIEADNSIFLRNIQWNSTTQIEHIKNHFGNQIKSWLYRPNFIANHFKVKGQTFIFDIEFFEQEHKFRISIFDKERIFFDLLQQLMIEASFEGDLKNNKYVFELSLLDYYGSYDLILSKLIQVTNFIHTNIDLKVFYKNLNQHQQKTLERVRKKQGKISVGFLVSDCRKWNLNDVFVKMSNSDQFAPRIILLKESMVYSFEDARYKEQCAFFKKIDAELIERLMLDNSAFDKKINTEFDIIFYQQPWDGMKYWLGRFYKHSLACYVPYSFIIYDSYLDYSLGDFHYYLWTYFSQSVVHKESHLDHEPLHSNKITVTGYPKLDVYTDELRINPFQDFKSVITGKKIVFAPHHSFKGSLLQIATFEWSGKKILDLKNKDQNHIWAFKPHGRFKHSLIEHKYLSVEETENYMSNWNSTNSFTYDSGDYFDLFKDSDILITDCSSFLAEYFPTGKPIIWLKSSISKMTFNKFGARLAEGFYCVNNPQELEQVYFDLLNGIDPLLEVRQKLNRELFNNGSVLASERLYSILLDRINA